MTPKIFVCQPIPEVALERMREYAEVEVFPYSHREISVGELESGARRSDYVFLMHSTPVTASMVAANPNLKGYGTSGRRPDVQDLEAIDAAGIPMLSPQRPSGQGPGGVGHATSDLMVAHILNLAYRVVEADKYCRRYGYFQEMTMDLMGVGTFGKTASLYGFGRVARGAAPTLRALGFTVLYTKRTRLSPDEEAEFGIEWVENKDELIARGDFVCLLTNIATIADPSKDPNFQMFGAREFALMKPSAFFINVARGRLVDPEAMTKALESGAIAGAGLDVFYDEPPLVYDAFISEVLRKMDNVTLTPHNGGATWDSRGRATLAIANAIVDDIIERAAAEEAAVSA